MLFEPKMLIMLFGLWLFSVAGPQIHAAGFYGKATAPVEIKAEIGPSQAALSFDFQAKATDVAIQVYGTDGLTVRGSEFPLTNAQFEAGQVQNLLVEFTSSSGSGNLAVVVNGKFNGKQISRVASFTVGDKAQFLKQDSITYDEQGEPIIVMPAE